MALDQLRSPTIDLTKWVQRPRGVRQMLRRYYHLFVKLNLIQPMVKEEKTRARPPHVPLLSLLARPVKLCF